MNILKRTIFYFSESGKIDDIRRMNKESFECIMRDLKELVFNFNLSDEMISDLRVEICHKCLDQVSYNLNKLDVHLKKGYCLLR